MAADELARSARPASAIPSLAAPLAAEPAPKRARNASPGADDERHIIIEATTTITGPAGTKIECDAEIAEAKQMVLDMKRQIALQAASGQALEDQGVDLPADTRGRKRGAGEDEGVTISGGPQVKIQRVIKKNRRAEAQAGQEASHKMAWGVAMFGLGVGAAACVSSQSHDRAQAEASVQIIADFYRLLPQIASSLPAFASQFF
jgi:hypothetical protein